MPEPVPPPQPASDSTKAWGLIGIVAWEFLSYPVFLALLMRWAAQKWELPVWTVAIAGFVGFGIGVWRLAVRFGVKK